MKKHIAFFLPFFLAHVVLCAPRAVPAPTTAPYAPDRKILASDFIRFEWIDAARNNRVVPVKIYFPKDDVGPFPVIVFSHGLGGTRETYEYLSRQWAAHGYVVVQPQHAGSDDKVWRESDGHPMQAMRQAANLENSISRAKDISFVIDQLDAVNKDDSKLKGMLDLARLGMSGHSFGAQTTMLISGQQLGPAMKLADNRIRAAIAMSAPAPIMKNKLDEVYAGIHLPVFLMTGTNDNSPIGETKAEDRRLAFDHLAHTIGYLLIFNGGDHMVFSGRLAPRPHDETFQRLIRISSTAFWDAYLKDDPAAKSWLNDGFKQLLASDGSFEMK